MMKTLVLHIPEDPFRAEPPRIANPLGEQQALTVVFQYQGGTFSWQLFFFCEKFTLFCTYTLLRSLLRIPNVMQLSCVGAFVK